MHIRRVMACVLLLSIVMKEPCSLSRSLLRRGCRRPDCSRRKSTTPNGRSSPYTCDGRLRDTTAPQSVLSRKSQACIGVGVERMLTRSFTRDPVRVGWAMLSDAR